MDGRDYTNAWMCFGAPDVGAVCMWGVLLRLLRDAVEDLEIVVVDLGDVYRLLGIGSK